MAQSTLAEPHKVHDIGWLKYLDIASQSIFPLCPDIFGYRQLTAGHLSHPTDNHSTAAKVEILTDRTRDSMACSPQVVDKLNHHLWGYVKVKKCRFTKVWTCLWIDFMQAKLVKLTLHYQNGNFIHTIFNPFPVWSSRLTFIGWSKPIGHGCHSTQPELENRTTKVRSLVLPAAPI